MTEKSVEDVLAEAAAATNACQVPPAKKERVKKTIDGGGAKPEKEPKAAKPPKEKKPAKTYPQANEDGTQKFEDDGVTPVMGAYATRFKEPKAPRAPSDRAGKYPATAKITLLTEKNPKREGSASHARFAAYKSGQTVAEALAAGLTTGDFHHDVAHGFISIDIGEVGEVEQAAAA